MIIRLTVAFGIVVGLANLCVAQDLKGMSIVNPECLALSADKPPAGGGLFGGPPPAPASIAFSVQATQAGSVFTVTCNPKRVTTIPGIFNNSVNWSGVFSVVPTMDDAKEIVKRLDALRSSTAQTLEEHRKTLLASVNELSKQVLTADTEAKLLEAVAQSKMFIELSRTVEDLRRRVEALEKKAPGRQ